MLYSISIIVPVYNGGTHFRKCLNSLEQCSPPPHEIIVVADGESDGSYRFALEKGHKVLTLERNSGPAVARNYGAEAASGEILLFIDADVTVEVDIIKKVRDTFAEDNSLSALIGSYDDKPGDPGFVSQYRNLLHHFTHQGSSIEASTFWGACGAITKEAFWSIDGFNSAYHTASIEDIELGYRLKNKGYSIKLVKNIQVTHLKQWGFINMLKTDVFLRAIPWSRLMIQRRNIINDLNVSHISKISTFCVLLLCAILLMFPIEGCFLPATILALFILFILLSINMPFYRFLVYTRGTFFMLRSLPLHWLYFLYSGLSFLAMFVYLFFSKSKNQSSGISGHAS